MPRLHSLPNLLAQVQFNSDAQSRPTLCNPMDWSTPGFTNSGACSNWCPSSRWWRPTFLSSVIPFPPAFNLSQYQGFFPMSQFFTSGGQSIGVSASASVLTMNIQDWFPSGWTGWISLQSKGLARVFSNIKVQKHQFFDAHISLQLNSHIHKSHLEKP